MGRGAAAAPEGPGDNEAGRGLRSGKVGETDVPRPRVNSRTLVGILFSGEFSGLTRRRETAGFRQVCEVYKNRAGLDFQLGML